MKKDVASESSETKETETEKQSEPSKGGFGVFLFWVIVLVLVGVGITYYTNPGFFSSNNTNTPTVKVVYVPDNVSRCGDGTVYNKCSSTQPMFCYNGVLVSRAGSCGCPEGQVADFQTCKVSNSSVTSTAVYQVNNSDCSDGTPSNKCSSTQPMFCYNGVLVSRAGSCGCPEGQVADFQTCKDVVVSQSNSTNSSNLDNQTSIANESSTNTSIQNQTY